MNALNVIFAGTPEFAASHLEALIAHKINVSVVVTQPDKPGKRGKKAISSPVKLLALEHQMKVIQPERLTAASLRDALPEHIVPDVMIVVAYGQILRTPVLAFPRLGCINVHASVLPRWRGAAPIQRAILAGDSETGITIIQMNAGLDTGDILEKASVSIEETDTAGSLTDKLAILGSKLMLRSLDGIASGTLLPIPQPADADGYAAKIEKEQALIDWTQNSDAINRQVRAYNPDPIAFTWLGNLRVKVWEASGPIPLSSIPHSPDKQMRKNVPPGQIIEVTDKGVLIATGDGAIFVNRLQLPLGKGSILTGRDILNSRTDLIHPGATFANEP